MVTASRSGNFNRGARIGQGVSTSIPGVAHTKRRGIHVQRDRIMRRCVVVARLAKPVRRRVVVPVDRVIRIVRVIVGKRSVPVRVISVRTVPPGIPAQAPVAAPVWPSKTEAPVPAEAPGGTPSPTKAAPAKTAAAETAPSTTPAPAAPISAGTSMKRCVTRRYCSSPRSCRAKRVPAIVRRGVTS